MTTIDITIKWESDRELPNCSIEYNSRAYNLIFVDGDADIRVYDATKWENFEVAKRNYSGLRFPSFIISRDEDESRWLEILSGDHGVCALSRIDEQLPILLVRMSARNFERGKLLHRSFLDPLTRVLPRVELNRRLDFELEMCNPTESLAVLFLDLDKFKNVNDNYGHHVGDFVIRRTAKILKEILREAPNVYRTGGDEFAVLMRMNQTQAIALGEYIRMEIEDHTFTIDNIDIRITASIGIAINNGEMDKDTFLKAADIAMYQAKSLGRNKVIEHETYFGSLEQEGGDPAILDFENRIKVLTERLTGALTSKSKQMVTQYKQEADHDGLTGLHIRRYFDRRLAREFEQAQNKKRPLSLIFIDLDHFGKVNKTYGFPTGDKTLQHVAEQIKDTIRVVDWSARYGGEEFCIVLPDTEEKQACEIAERVWKEIGKEPVKVFDGREFTLTASIGVAEVIIADADITAFIQRTSDRTRYAKEHGRNQVCCHG